MKKIVICTVLTAFMFATAACGKEFTEGEIAKINNSLEAVVNSVSGETTRGDYYFDESKAEANLYLSFNNSKSTVKFAISRDQWNSFKESMEDLSRTQKDFLSYFGVERVNAYIVEEITYSHNYGSDEILLSVTNGTTTYDFYDE